MESLTLFGQQNLDFRSRNVRDFVVQKCNREDVVSFVEHWHYSHSINGLMISVCFRLLCDGEMIGACIFGKLGMANAWKKYGESEDEVIELRRLCCIDNTPKNTESYFIGHCLRWLKENTAIKTVVSYADPNHGHQGTIYRASNFQYKGLTSDGRVIIMDGKQYHDKAIRTKYNGELKPFAKRLSDALESGEAHYEKQEGKHIYLYSLAL